MWVVIHGWRSTRRTLNVCGSHHGGATLVAWFSFLAVQYGRCGGIANPTRMLVGLGRNRYPPQCWRPGRSRVVDLGALSASVVARSIVMWSKGHPAQKVAVLVCVLCRGLVWVINSRQARPTLLYDFGPERRNFSTNNSADNHADPLLHMGVPQRSVYLQQQMYRTLQPVVRRSLLVG